MFKNLKIQWRHLKQAPPGTRFRHRYKIQQKAGRSAIAKPFYLGGGIVVFVIGIVLLPAPGPGFIFVLIGAALMAEESYYAASALDWLELRVRHLSRWAGQMWKRMPLAVKGLAAGIVAIAAGAAGWGAYVLVFA